jgi:hypothetical protein
MESNDCEICGSEFSKRNKRVDCMGCAGGACRGCWERWVLGSKTEKCMYPECGCDLTNRFFFENFTKTFVTKALKSHREERYFDQERALLPATQELVEVEIREEMWTNITRKFNKRYSENSRRLALARVEAIKVLNQEDFGILLVDVGKARVDPRQNVFWRTEDMGIYGEDREEKPMLPPWVRLYIAGQLARKIKGVDKMKMLPMIRSIRDGGPISDFMFLAALVVMRGGRLWFSGEAKWLRYYNTTFADMNNFYRTEIGVISDEYRTALAAEGLERRAPSRITSTNGARFTRACPHETCKGYLNMSWNCGLCKERFCKECHQPDDENHVCEDDDVATAKLIMSETKPCPGCSISITKIDGCDQMWCTQCRTAWDWKTGQIQTRVHNPHYFEYLRTRGDGGAVAPRNPDEIRCGREFDTTFISSLSHILRKLKVGDDLQNRIVSVIAGWNELDNNHTDRNLGDSPNTQQLRIDYMRGKLSEPEFKRRVQMKHKKWNKEVEIRDLIVMFKQTVIDIMYRFRHAMDMCDDPAEVHIHEAIFDEIVELEAYSNVCLTNISKKYQSVELAILIRQRVLINNRYVSVGVYNRKKGY